MEGGKREKGKEQTLLGEYGKLPASWPDSLSEQADKESAFPAGRGVSYQNRIDLLASGTMNRIGLA